MPCSAILFNNDLLFNIICSAHSMRLSGMRFRTFNTVLRYCIVCCLLCGNAFCSHRLCNTMRISSVHAFNARSAFVCLMHFFVVIQYCSDLYAISMRYIWLSFNAAFNNFLFHLVTQYTVSAISVVCSIPDAISAVCTISLGYRSMHSAGCLFYCDALHRYAAARLSTFLRYNNILRLMQYRDFTTHLRDMLCCSHRI
jgi:hypothetical protein